MRNYEVVTAYRMFEYNIDGMYEQNQLGYVFSESEAKAKKNKNAWISWKKIHAIRVIGDNGDYEYFPLASTVPIGKGESSENKALKENALSKLTESEKKALGLLWNCCQLMIV